MGRLSDVFGVENPVALVTGSGAGRVGNAMVRALAARGYRCVVLADCCASYFPEFHEAGLRMVRAQGGIFGWVSASQPFLSALTAI